MVQRLGATQRLDEAKQNGDSAERQYIKPGIALRADPEARRRSILVQGAELHWRKRAREFQTGRAMFVKLYFARYSLFPFFSLLPSVRKLYTRNNFPREITQYACDNAYVPRLPLFLRKIAYTITYTVITHNYKYCIVVKVAICCLTQKVFLRRKK